MLDGSESSMFDDAMSSDPALRKYALEMDRLSAAIAASAAPPVAPGAGQLERIQNRLNLNPARRLGIWLAITGWAAAVALAVTLVTGRSSGPDQAKVERQAVSQEPDPIQIKDDGNRTPAKAVAKRLTQEIVVLRENLEKFQHRDRVLFAAVPGRALPIVMTMTPPGVPAEDSPITTLLGDAMRAVPLPEEDLGQDSGELPEIQAVYPSAMPIYDSARDLGTLVVNNLPELGEGQVYNLWVTTEPGDPPVYVGSLPATSTTGAESFDFSLGSTMVLPTGFTLTKDPLEAPASPTQGNIVLQGPPTSSP